LERGKSQEQYEKYYNSLKNYKYSDRGVGYIQTTFVYNQQAFATFLFASDYPELNVSVRYANNTSASQLKEIYDNTLNLAGQNVIDFSDYRAIPDNGTDYIASNYAWTISGYWWLANDLNQKIADMQGDPNTIDMVSNVVNLYDSKEAKAERRRNYELVSQIIK